MTARHRRSALASVMLLAVLTVTGCTKPTESAVRGGAADDTSISKPDGSDTLLLGDLEITFPPLAEFEQRSESFTIPPAWPGSEHARDLVTFASSGDANPEGLLPIGVMVFDRPDAVTDAERRDQLLTDSARVAAGPAFPWSTPAAFAHIVGEREGQSVECWLDLRHESDRDHMRDHATLLIAGEGIASSGIVVTAFPERGLDTWIADFAEAACGSRPDLSGA